MCRTLQKGEAAARPASSRTHKSRAASALAGRASAAHLCSQAADGGLQHLAAHILVQPSVARGHAHLQGGQGSSRRGSAVLTAAARAGTRETQRRV